MVLSRLITGRRGEDEAARFLRKKGYRILKRNYSCRFGEIDLVARDGDTVVFVEVKTRRSSSFGPAAEAVDRRKMGRIKKASEFFLKEFNLTEHAARFDVVCIENREGGPCIELIKNAFGAP